MASLYVCVNLSRACCWARSGADKIGIAAEQVVMHPAGPAGTPVIGRPALRLQDPGAAPLARPALIEDTEPAAVQHASIDVPADRQPRQLALPARRAGAPPGVSGLADDVHGLG